MIVLTVLTLAAVLLLVGTLWVALVKIYNVLEDIGGASTSSPASLLAQIRWGVRAIERQTQAIGPHARRLAATMNSIDEAFAALERNPGRRTGARG
jgi:hypothetical protein